MIADGGLGYSPSQAVCPQRFVAMDAGLSGVSPDDSHSFSLSIRKQQPFKTENTASTACRSVSAFYYEMRNLKWLLPFLYLENTDGGDEIYRALQSHIESRLCLLSFVTLRFLHLVQLRVGASDKRSLIHPMPLLLR